MGLILPPYDFNLGRKLGKLEDLEGENEREKALSLLCKARNSEKLEWGGRRGLYEQIAILRGRGGDIFGRQSVMK